MSDTRTIYLKNNEGTIYSSDPSNLGYEYLNISDFDSLNPSENSIFTSATNISLMYSSYDVKLVLTFVSNYDNGRQARADWIAKNQNSINQISVANTNNPNLIFSKQAKIKTIDFVENPYVNGVQAELTLELAGRWQSSVNRTSATVYPYTGGTKKYTYKYRQQNPIPQTNSQGQSNKLLNTEFTPDFYGWYDRGLHGVAIKAEIGAPVNGSNVFVKVAGSPTRLQSEPISVVPGTKISYSIQKLASSNMWSYINNVDINGNMVNVPGTSSPEFGSIQSMGYTKLENITIPAGVNYISLGLYVGGVSNGNVFSQPLLVFSSTVGDYVQGIYKDLSTNTYKYGYQIITDEVKTDGYNGFIINIPSQTTPVNVTLTAPSGLSATLTTSQTNVPLQISSDMIGYSLDNFNTFTLLNKGFPASKYWDNLLSVYSTIQTILNADKVTVSVSSNTGSTIPFEFYLYKLQDLI